MKRIHLKAKPSDQSYLCGKTDHLAIAGREYMVLDHGVARAIDDKSRLCQQCVHIAKNEGLIKRFSG